jgi:hypothetical protein
VFGTALHALLSNGNYPADAKQAGMAHSAELLRAAASVSFLTMCTNLLWTTGDSLSSSIAAPYSTTTSTNMWPIYCNRSVLALLCGYHSRQRLLLG